MIQLTIALDFDGTLCTTHEFPNIGEPRTWLIERAIEWRKMGHKLILWTCRENVHVDEYSPYWAPGEYLNEAVEWCKLNGLEFDGVNQNLYELDDPKAKASRKITADLYIDDKSIVFDDITNSLIMMGGAKIEL